MLRISLSGGERRQLTLAVCERLDHIYRYGSSEEAVVLFRLLYRLRLDRSGPPAYPEYSEENVEKLLEAYGYVSHEAER